MLPDVGFKAKMYPIRFPIGLRLRPRLGSLQRSPRSPAVFKGPTSKGRENDEKGTVCGKAEKGGGGKG